MGGRACYCNVKKEKRLYASTQFSKPLGIKPFVVAGFIIVSHHYLIFRCRVLHHWLSWDPIFHPCPRSHPRHRNSHLIVLEWLVTRKSYSHKQRFRSGLPPSFNTRTAVFGPLRRAAARTTMTRKIKKCMIAKQIRVWDKEGQTETLRRFVQCRSW